MARRPRGATARPFAEALHLIREAHQDASTIIETSPHAAEAFNYATQLADALREAANATADLRARTAARIAEEEQLSLAVLADRLGVSKARAGQLMQTARKTRATDGEGSPENA